MRGLILALCLSCSFSAFGQTSMLDDLGVHGTRMIFNMNLLKNKKTIKRTVENGFRDKIEIKSHFANGKMMRETPTFEKYCTVTVNLDLKEYLNLSESNYYHCRLKNIYEESWVQTIEFEQVYCPKIECHQSWLDLFSGYSINNFKYNLGKFLREINI